MEEIDPDIALNALDFEMDDDVFKVEVEAEVKADATTREEEKKK